VGDALEEGGRVEGEAGEEGGGEEGAGDVEEDGLHGGGVEFPILLISQLSETFRLQCILMLSLFDRVISLPILHLVAALLNIRSIKIFCFEFPSDAFESWEWHIQRWIQVWLECGRSPDKLQFPGQLFPQKRDLYFNGTELEQF
jgi:hypothetical protein